MKRDRLAALEAQLGEPAPEALSGLSDAQLENLAAAVRDARHRQAAELAAAGEQAFSAVPRLLRVPIRRILG